MDTLVQKSSIQLRAWVEGNAASIALFGNLMNQVDRKVCIRVVFDQTFVAAARKLIIDIATHRASSRQLHIQA